VPGYTEEVGKTVRYALGSNERTARLIALMLIVMIGWYICGLPR
jgi:hypothetical protein